MSLLTLLQSGGAVVVSGNGLVYYRSFWEQDMQFLRQSTASQEVFLGPFVSDTDFKTAQTGLTIGNTDIKIWKNGAITEVNKNSGGATHVASGRYYAVLDATDTDTVGMLELNIAVSGALPVKSKYYVLTQSVYDSLFATSSTGPLKPTVDGRTLDITATGAAGIDWGNVENQSYPVNLSDTTVSVVSLVNLVESTDVVTLLASGAVTASSIAANALDNKGNWNVGKSGYALTPTTGLGNQTANITGNLSGSVGSVTSGVTVATNNDKTGYSLVVAPLTSSQTASAVWDALIASYTVSGSFGARVMRLDSASSGNAAKVTAAGHVASDVHELQPAVIDNTHFAAGAIDANALAADAATEIATAVAATQALSRLDSMIESDGAGQFRFDTIALSMAPGGGGGGGTDWTTAERTALRSILGFDASGNVIDPTVGILDTIRDKTALISANTIFVSNPVAALGNIRAPIFINTDYLAAQGNAFTWTIPAISGWTAATVTPLFGLRLGTAKVQVIGTATDNGNGTWDLVFDVVALDTVAMVPGYYSWTVDVSYQQYIITKVYSDKPVELRYNETDAPLPP